MSKRQDLTGMVFGTIKVLGFAGKNGHNQNVWNCQCMTCNRKSIKRTQQTRKGCISCSKKKHGEHYTELYRHWAGMKDRCQGKRKYYENIELFGGWNDFIIFKAWALANGYKNGLELDRINIKRGYAPDNCRWVNDRTQANNKRSNLYFEINP